MNRIDVLEDLISQALKCGATHADAIIIDSMSNSVEVRLQKATSVEYSQDESLGLRVLVDGRQAIVSSSDFSKASLLELANRAVAMAKSVPSNPHLFLASKEDLAQFIPELDLFDSQELTSDKLLESAFEAEAIAMEDSKIQNSSGSSVGYTKNKIYFATSHGFANQYASSYFSKSISVIAGKDENMQTDYAYSVARYWNDLKSSKDIGLEARERTIKKLFPKKINSTQVPLIFENRVASGLLGAFLSAINGAAFSRGTSFLIDNLGKEIFSKSINIVDDPFIQRGLGSRPFDGEGLLGEKLLLVENGIANHLLLDMQTASKLNLSSNARASRGLSSIPSPSSTNSYINAGERSLEDAVKSLKNGILVTDIIGHGANIITGEYSQGASGFYIENGEIVYPVSEITIAGNLKTMFKNLEALSDLRMEKSTNSPSLLVDKMTIAGV